MHDHIEDKFQRYLQEAEINFRIVDDPIDWRRKHESHVAKLARKYDPCLNCTFFLHSKEYTPEKTTEPLTRTAR
jgi:hypothetical protein